MKKKVGHKASRVIFLYTKLRTNDRRWTLEDIFSVFRSCLGSSRFSRSFNVLVFMSRFLFCLCIAFFQVSTYFFLLSIARSNIYIWDFAWFHDSLLLLQEIIKKDSKKFFSFRFFKVELHYADRREKKTDWILKRNSNNSIGVASKTEHWITVSPNLAPTSNRSSNLSIIFNWSIFNFVVVVVHDDDDDGARIFF